MENLMEKEYGNIIMKVKLKADMLGNLKREKEMVQENGLWRATVMKGSGNWINFTVKVN